MTSHTDANGLPHGYAFKPDYEVTPKAAKAALASAAPTAPLILDVRTPEEYAVARVEPSQLIPLHELEKRADEIDLAPGQEVLVLCHHGVRSMKATLHLRAIGIPAKSIAGGIEAWSLAADPTIPRYERTSGTPKVVK